MTVSSEPIQQALGMDCNLICTVKVNPYIDTPVTVTAEWTGPNQIALSKTAKAVKEDSSTLTCTAMASSLGGGSGKGTYTCKVAISSPSVLLHDSDSTSGAITVTLSKSVYSHSV